jgi:phenylacetic acid degradation operon negative regulatory protein
MKGFHHPDISWPVIRRRVGAELLDFIAQFGEAMVTGGRSFTWASTRPDRRAYHEAVRRLRKAGLVTSRKAGGAAPVLMLTPRGELGRSESHRPERWWKQRWDGRWYLLAYDVPEKQRGYRDGLRAFIVRLKLGCLQKSLWITPRDIRPEYDDLMQGTEAGTYSHLFEARTVLGRRPEELVDQAWDFDALDKAQADYCRETALALRRVEDRKTDGATRVRLARAEMLAYLSAMCDDPLLPRDLWPHGYRGEEAWRMHQAFAAAVRLRL